MTATRRFLVLSIGAALAACVPTFEPGDAGPDAGAGQGWDLPEPEEMPAPEPEPEPLCPAALPAVTPGLTTCALPGAHAIEVDTRTDPDHCGICFRACESCIDGVCEGAARIALGSEVEDLGQHVAVSGDIVAVVGHVGQTPRVFGERVVSIPPGAAYATRGLSDGFLAVYDRDSLEPRFSVSFGSEGDDVIDRVAIAADGRIVVVGSFEGEVDIGGVARLASHGGSDALVAVFEPTGCLRWARALGGAGYDHATALAVDDFGRIYVGGTAGGWMDAGGADVPAGAGAAYVLGLSRAGTLRWSRSFGEPGPDADSGVDALAIAPDRTLYVGGALFGSAEVGPYRIESSSDSDAFFAHLRLDGDVLGARALGGGSSQGIAEIGFRQEGGAVLFGWSERGALEGVSGGYGDFDMFLVELDHEDETVWAERIPTGNLETAAFAVDDDDTIHVLTTGLEDPEGGPASGAPIAHYTRALGMSRGALAPIPGDRVLDYMRFGALAIDDERTLWAAGGGWRGLPRSDFDPFDARLFRVCEGCDWPTISTAWTDGIPAECGDGDVVPYWEACDDGVNDGSYGTGCMPHCRALAPHCGDEVVQPEHEDCDDFRDPTCIACRWPLGVCGDGAIGRGEICYDDPAETLPTSFVPDRVSARGGSGLSSFDRAIGVARRDPPAFEVFVRSHDTGTYTTQLSVTPAGPIDLPPWNVAGHHQGGDRFTLLGGACPDCLSVYTVAPTPSTTPVVLERTAWDAAAELRLGGDDILGLAYGSVVRVGDTIYRHDHGVARAMRFNPDGWGEPLYVAFADGVASYGEVPETRWFTAAAIPAGAVGVYIVDLDRDGTEEVAVVLASARAIRFALADGAPLPDVVFLDVAAVRTALSADLDHDGQRDLLLATTDDRLVAFASVRGPDAAWERTWPCAIHDLSEFDLDSYDSDSDEEVDLLIASACGAFVLMSTP